jgi:hypothetical protein
MHGGSATHLVIVPILASLAALAAATPALARDSALLGGYGGPGQGNQVILGSTLLNGPRDGGGGGGSGRAISAAVAGTSTLGAPTGGGSGSPTGSPARRLLAPGRQGKPAPGALEQASGQASRPARADSQTLGLTGEELLLSLVALAALTLTGVLTRRLTRTSEPRRHA